MVGKDERVVGRSGEGEKGGGSVTARKDVQSLSHDHLRVTYILARVKFPLHSELWIF